MNTSLIENILMIAQERGVKKAAERLFISQPALNQQLLKLEEELHTKLFNRNNWMPTQSGQIYLEAGERMLELKRNAYGRIGQLNREEKHVLNVGASRGVNSVMIAGIYQELLSRHPDWVIHVNTGFGTQLYDEVVSQKLDIAFTTLDPRTIFNIQYQELLQEDMYLAMKKDNPLVSHIYMDPEDQVPCIDLGLCKGESFILSEPDSLNYWIDMQIFKIKEMNPDIYMAGGGADLLRIIVEAGKAVAIIPEHGIGNFSEEITTARLDIHHHLYMVAIYKKGRKLRAVEQDLIDAAKKYYSGWKHPYGVVN